MAKFKPLIKYIFLLCFLTASYFSQNETFYIIDADTIHIGNDKFRLKGIDAPETKQTCICSGKKVFCGQQSTAFLKTFVRGKKVTCERKSKDIYDRFLSECFVQDDTQKISLNRWLVENGYAMTYKKTTESLLELQSQAIREKRGLWACEFFQNPSDFRKAQKQKQRLRH